MAIEIFEGSIFHARTKPKPHRFRYPTFFIELNLEDIPFQKYFYSVHIENYLDGHSGNPKEIFQQFLQQNGIHKKYKKVTLQTFPKAFGYVFNPVSFWSLRDENNVVTAVLCEVNNTFGERHFYWLEGNESVFADVDFYAEKQFHVSPFFPVQGRYRFRLENSPRKVTIDYFDSNETLLLNSYVLGRKSESSWLKMIFKYGLISFLVISRIHWQALQLWLKDAKFHSKPDLQTQRITFSQKRSRTAKD